MSAIFEPQEETVEGWRATILGAIACKLGWHFGQIGEKGLIICSKCKISFFKVTIFLRVFSEKCYVPRRTHLVYKDYNKHFDSLQSLIYSMCSDPIQTQSFRDLFKYYQCMDCKYKTSDAQKITDHQKEWHNCETWWQRLKDS